MVSTEIKLSYSLHQLWVDQASSMTSVYHPMPFRRRSLREVTGRSDSCQYEISLHGWKFLWKWEKTNFINYWCSERGTKVMHTMCMSGKKIQQKRSWKRVEEFLSPLKLIRFVAVQFLWMWTRIGIFMQIDLKLQATTILYWSRIVNRKYIWLQ